MPSGKIHAVATTLVGGSIGPFLMLAGRLPPEQAAAFTAGCMAGLIVNPDLDVRHPTYSGAILRRSGGGLLGWLWSLVWWPYAHLIIPHHRHPLSHLPILGTAIRVIYLLAIVVFAWWVLRLAMRLPVLPPFLHGDLWWWGLGGLALVDGLHTFMDLVWP